MADRARRARYARRARSRGCRRRRRAAPGGPARTRRGPIGTSRSVSDLGAPGARRGGRRRCGGRRSARPPWPRTRRPRARCASPRPWPAACGPCRAAGRRRVIAASAAVRQAHRRRRAAGGRTAVADARSSGVVEHDRILDDRARRHEHVVDALRGRPADAGRRPSSSSPRRRRRRAPPPTHRPILPPTSSASAPRPGQLVEVADDDGAGTAPAGRSMSSRGLAPPRRLVVVRREVDVEHPHGPPSGVDRDVDADAPPPGPDRPAAARNALDARRSRCGVSTARPSARWTTGQCLRAQRRDRASTAPPASRAAWRRWTSWRATTSGACGADDGGDGGDVEALRALHVPGQRPARGRSLTCASAWQRGARPSRTVERMAAVPPFLHPFAKPTRAGVHRHRPGRGRARLGHRRQRVRRRDGQPVVLRRRPRARRDRRRRRRPAAHDRRLLLLRPVLQRAGRRARRARSSS